MGYRFKVAYILVGWCVVVLVGALSTDGLDSTHGEDDHVNGKPMGSDKRNPCELLSDNVTINCANRGLSSIPKNFKFKCKDRKCIKIDLSGNRIRKIGDNTFKNLPHIEFIDLSKNNLTKISRKAFNRLDFLNSLRLNNNSLRYDTLPPAAFKPLSNLKTLFIENQVLQKTKYPSQILSSLSKLKNLSMDFVYNENVAYGLQQAGHRVTKFDVTFEAAKGLANITMFAPGKDPLFVPEDTFQHISNITVLSVRSCRIGEIEETALSNFTQLQSLDLGLNKKLGLNASVNLLRHLNSPLTHLDLEYVNPLFQPVKLTKELMSVFKHLPIQNLSLVQDYITMLDGDNLRNNWNYLKTLYIGKNWLFTSGGKRNLLNIARNAAQMNKLTFIDASYWHTNSKITDYLGPTDLSEPSKEFINHPTHFRIRLPRNLTTVILQGTFRPGMFVYDLDCVPNRLTHLDASHSNFRFWPFTGDPYPCFNSVQVLDMGYNDFATIEADRYKTFPSLEKMILAGNRLYVVLQDQKKKHFVYLNYLTHLDLSDNNIVNELYPEMFNELPKLRRIILRRNRLLAVTAFKQHSVEFIDFYRNFIDNPYMNMTEMPSLKKVSFARNSIRVVSETSLRVWRGKNISINFTRNHFNCSSCQFLPFLRWFNNVSSDPRTVTLLHSENYRCDDGSELYVREVSLDDLTHKCTSFAWIVISTSLSIVVALFITLGSLLYRHRWTIRSLGASTRHMRRRFQFDASVVYSFEDRHWVHDVLRTRLEEASDFGLCIHYRNFLPGRGIEENIIDAIESSRHSMLVVSRYSRPNCTERRSYGDSELLLLLPTGLIHKLRRTFTFVSF